jgi:hypothetical protein
MAEEPKGTGRICEILLHIAERRPMDETKMKFISDGGFGGMSAEEKEDVTNVPKTEMHTYHCENTPECSCCACERDRLRVLLKECLPYFEELRQYDRLTPRSLELVARIKEALTR